MEHTHEHPTKPSHFSCLASEVQESVSKEQKLPWLSQEVSSSLLLL